LHDGPGRNRVPAIQADAGNWADSKTMAWASSGAWAWAWAWAWAERERWREGKGSWIGTQSGSRPCNLSTACLEHGAA
jgi:hypothetical protein